MSSRSLSRRAFLGAITSVTAAQGLGRTPYAGRLRLTTPWPIHGLDPALLSDGFSALFAAAVFDPLFALDAAGKPYPALASKLPTSGPDGVRVTVRPGLKTSAGKPLGGADVLATLERARARGAAGLLGEIERPRLDANDRLAVVFPKSSIESVSAVLSSPLLALVPRGFSPLAPDGTGAFRIELSRGRALLTRNLSAARGAAFLEAIEVGAATELSDLLRGFEAGSTDVGWFGTGLYRAVKEAVAFEAPRYGFAVLMSGRLAGAWGAPGTLQALLDAVPQQQLAHLGLRGLPTHSAGDPRWGGASLEMAVPEATPQLTAIARALATTLSTAGHVLTIAEKSVEELGRLRASNQFGLMVDFVRSPGLGDRDAEWALRTAVSPDAARRAPKTAAMKPRELGRALPLGVIGELSVHGARRSTLSGLENWQLGAVSLRS